MEQQTILIIDDDPTWLKLLSRFFSDNGYAVRTAISCASAIETIRFNKSDCVVLDFNLSDGDATCVCAAIRTGEEHRTPIVIFSSDPAAEVCLDSEHRADKFLFKTAPLKELLAAVTELLAVHN